MAQPISIIYFPYNYVNRQEIDKIVFHLNGWDDNSKENPPNPLGGYLWFCFEKDGIDAPEFVVYYEKDFNEIKYEELKALIIENLSKTQDK